MDSVAVETWLNSIETTDATSPGPLAGQLDISGIRSVSAGMLAGKSAATELDFFQHMRDTYGENINPKEMTDEQLERYLAEIKDHPSVGMSTIARLSQIKSTWSPIIGHKNNKPELFANYLDILSTAPCMSLGKINNKELTYREKNYDKMIQDIADVILEYLEDSGGKKEIVKRITQLAKCATSNQEIAQVDTLFAQNAVVLDADKVGYRVFFSRVTMTWTKEGKAEVMESSLKLYAMDLTFSIETWKSGMYSVIGSKQYRDDNEWINGMESSEGANQRKLCIEDA